MADLPRLSRRAQNAHRGTPLRLLICTAILDISIPISSFAINIINERYSDLLGHVRFFLGEVANRY
ncbi:hypothetical protein, partial [Mycobacteroides abscessus]|uniref:hypothetical protein n=1 Tax=Mycobacteroides abscessus TaxID=36809 RepID=UPI002102E5A5